MSLPQYTGKCDLKVRVLDYTTTAISVFAILLVILAISYERVNAVYYELTDGTAVLTVERIGFGGQEVHQRIREAIESLWPQTRFSRSRREREEQSANANPNANANNTNTNTNNANANNANANANADTDSNEIADANADLVGL